MGKSRRTFVKQMAVGTTGVMASAPFLSNASVLGANDRVGVAVVGVNGQGSSLARAMAPSKNCEIVYMCDVEENALQKGMDRLATVTDKKPKTLVDFRKALDDKSVDAIVIAAPDHWHGPATIMACQAGKHVYVEKPCSHNPREGEMMIEAARKYNRVVQMGSQRRSWPSCIQAMSELHNGRIGKVYFAKAWYANNRGPIGTGKITEVPSRLNYELWQGPAPRRPYQDNLIHYNWHWFWHWGTGEALNNGTHEIDLIRWGFDEDYPSKVTSLGGRYHYKDDWEAMDTQVINFEFGDQKSAMWEGRSCNPRAVEGGGRGVVFYGTQGTMVTTGGPLFQFYDLNDELIEEFTEGGDEIDPMQTSFPAAQLAVHLEDFFNAILTGSQLNAQIETGYKSTLICMLGNIAQRTGSALEIDQQNGHILNNEEAMKLWSRKYEPGWELKV